MHRKFHKATFLTIGIVIIGAILAIHFSLPFFLARSLSSALGENSSVGSVRIQLNKIVIKEIKIENPPLSKLKYALKIDELIITAPLIEYLQPQVDIKQILLDKIYMSVEFYTKDRKESNWNSILANVNKPVAEEKKEPSHPGDRRKITIGNLTLNDIQVELMFANSKPELLPMLKQISINDIDPENGLLTKRITRILTNHIIQSISKGFGIQGITGVILSAPSAVVDTIILPFKMFDKKNKDKQKSEH
ncbi:MAG: hypothetical protein P0S95_07395 [Rhabdochlamydiaceae bacterium]|nr:hypothetical protein [Candidatus Amphrikana amoebophyrae]